MWKTRYATIGVLICWDQWYPEAARITSLLGAQVLFYPTAIGWHPSEKKEWGQAQVDAWRTMQRAHAIANGVYVASPNRIGHEDEPGTDGITFFGHSFIADPFGRYIAEAGEQRRDPDREVRHRADRRGAPQLAVPPRSACRRLRADPQPLSRSMTYRMPAEWEAHRATWISWPHHEPDWPGKLGPIPWVYAEIARVIAEHETVEILCASEEIRAAACDILDAHAVHRDRVRLHIVPDRSGLASRLGADRCARRISAIWSG